jgi:drug/metabolite transporter (DMT)-like permease
MPGWKDYLQLHFIVLIWGFTAILGLLISIPAVELVFFRTLLAFGMLGIMLVWQKQNLVIGKASVLKMLLTGSLIAVHWILFFAAARVSTASITLAGMATGSLWASFLEPVIRGRKIQVLEIFMGMVVIAGLYVVFHFEFNHALGITMALVSAFIGALFTVLNGEFSSHHNHQVITFYEMAGACLTTLLFLPFYSHYLSPTHQLQLLPTLPDWLWISILAGLCTVYAYSASVKLMQKFSAFAVTLTVNMEPIYGILLAFMIFGEAEKMTAGFYLGTTIILSAVLLYPFLNKHLTRRQAQFSGIQE